MSSIPRSEYPRPQCVRRDWLCLNGDWEFETDAGDSGRERGLLDRPLSGKILVPFCIESELSGVGHTDFVPAVWYRKVAQIPPDWRGRDVLLHFQAVDYDATVWVNGVEVGRHRGGFTPFECDLTGVAAPGETVTIVVRARDDHRQSKPAGKQSSQYANHGCHYTRTTGIWQTVWMEPVPQRGHLRRPRITPDLNRSRFRVEATLWTSVSRHDTRIVATLRDAHGVIATDSVSATADVTPSLELVVPEGRRRAWCPEDPHLYDIEIAWLNEHGIEIDRVGSYAGLRSVAIDGKAMLLNGKRVFQRLVLDQGYWPESLMTAPSDAALKRDIELSMSVGFNGARLHQKVFEERYLYWADRLGYLCWGEFPDWGIHTIGPAATYVTQWLEALHRDYSHPCIIGWCGLNETWGSKIGDAIDGTNDLGHGFFLAAKAIDSTRPVLDASGWAHRVRRSDVWDSHDYEQDPQKLAANHAGLTEDKPQVNTPDKATVSVAYRGQPFFVSEFGGIWWNPDARPGDPSWGYGQRPTSADEFFQRFAGQCRVLLGNPSMFGYCYTQLTDTFQEQNGLFFFDRRPKFDPDTLKALQSIRAAIENGD